MKKSQTNLKIPDLLCIGFFCHDQYNDELLLGGTAAYSSLMTNYLGKQTAVLTSVGNDFNFFHVFEKAGIQIKNKFARKTTVFKNIYENKTRIQYIKNPAKKLTINDLPENWENIPIVKFCLIADEVDFDLVNVFPNALVGVTIQGWLRKWDKNGKISPKLIDWSLLKNVDIVFMSIDDLADFEEEIPKITEVVSILVMTKGEKGAVVFYQNKMKRFPAFPTKAVDPTGAGDIFAAAFLVKYSETKDIEISMAFAHSAASFIVEDIGIHFPKLEQIEGRFEEYKSRFL